MVGEAGLELRTEGAEGCRGFCLCVCERERVCEVRPLHSKVSLGTTAGTRLLLGLSTVAPQEQQKTPPNAPCSSSVNTHTWNQADPHKHTTHTASKLPQRRTHSRLIVFSVTHVCIMSAFAGQRDGKSSEVR